MVFAAAATHVHHGRHAPTAPRAAGPSAELLAELGCLRRRAEDAAAVCDDLYHHHDLYHDAPDEDVRGDDPFSGSKLFVLGVLCATLAAAFWFYRHLDNLPTTVKRCAWWIVGKEVDAATPPMRKLVAYRIDCWFSSNPNSKSLALLYLSLALVVYGGGFLYAVSATGFGESLFETLVGLGIDWTFASAAESDFYSASGLLTRLVAIVSSLGGMFITALLLGIVSDSVAGRVDDLKKGRSDVLEQRHTLILGWSEKVVSVVEQISLANESCGGGTIVLLSERDKEAQEAAMRDHGYAALGTTVICRQGNPLMLHDLRKVSASRARCIVIIADEGCTPDQSDARSLRIVLSLVGLRESGARSGGGLEGYVVVEVQDIDNEPLMRMVGGESIETIVAHDIVGRLMIQCARQPGLAQVWGGLLGFDGAEFYLKSWPELQGETFGGCLCRFAEAVPIGILRSGGALLLNPGDGAVLGVGDLLCVIAEDDDSYAPSAVAPLAEAGALEALAGLPLAPAPAPECVLFCGWRRDMDDIVQLLDDFVVEGSELHLFNEVDVEDQRARLQLQRDQRRRPPGLTHLTVHHTRGKLCSRRDLEKLPIRRFTSAIILANEDADVDATATDRDSQALATLLLLRDLQSQIRAVAADGASIRASPPAPPPSDRRGTARRPSFGSPQGVASWAEQMRSTVAGCVVLSEILDARTQELIHEAGISDYVLSNKLVSMTVAMVAEDRQVNNIVKSLFEAEGSELYCRPASRYVKPGDVLSFFDVMRRARLRPEPEIVVGYKAAGDAEAVLNPPDKHVPRLWGPDEMLIVLAED
ncbi:hypothetical protein M885DRAFT_448106 [Pelagophyceae sp. CCMP2097]|nr:hypothetical protein M885DRAFT_448106 [Pelagophyceae sp. CCMP2097]